VLGTVALAAKGLLYGGLAALFFIRKQRVVLYGAGFGAGLSVFNELNK